MVDRQESVIDGDAPVACLHPGMTDHLVLLCPVVPHFGGGLAPGIDGHQWIGSFLTKIEKSR